MSTAAPNCGIREEKAQRSVAKQTEKWAGLVRCCVAGRLWSKSGKCFGYGDLSNAFGQLRITPGSQTGPSRYEDGLLEAAGPRGRQARAAGGVAAGTGRTAAERPERRGDRRGAAQGLRRVPVARERDQRGARCGGLVACQ